MIYSEFCSQEILVFLLFSHMSLTHTKLHPEMQIMKIFKAQSFVISTEILNFLIFQHSHVPIFMKVLWILCLGIFYSALIVFNSEELTH